jgi:hypothetical protein
MKTINQSTRVSFSCLEAPEHQVRGALSQAAGPARLSAAATLSSIVVLAACSVLVLSAAPAHAQANMAPAQTAQSQAAAAKQSNVSQARELQPKMLGNGRIWVVEDPVLLVPSLSVSATDKVALKDGSLAGPITFNVYTNYAAFLKRAELRIFGPNDPTRLKPLAVLPVAIDRNKSQFELKWSGSLPQGTAPLRRSDKLQYVLRVYNEQDSWDETRSGSMEVVSEIEKTQSLDLMRATLGQQLQVQAERAGQSLQDYAIGQTNFGNSNLVTQNIPLFGSRIRVRGQGIPEGVQVKINGQTVPVDAERKFVSEYLLPLGQHQFDQEISKGGQTEKAPLQVNVSGEYWFMVAMADLTVSQNSYSGKVEAVTPEDYERFGGRYTDARLAFYLKGKIKGRYLLTAQADTLERDTKELFKRLFKADRTDLIRRIDPDAYYPVFGDDSTTTQDVDTLGRLYVRLDWDRSSALWGKVRTDFNGNDLAQFNRELYGARLALRSVEITENGQAKSQLRAFVAEQQTSPGSSQFWGTGGSLYFLRHADVVPGSQRVQVQVRDKDSERVVSTYELIPGRDYELNAFQGRVILSRPLQQIVRDNSLTADQPGQSSSFNVLSVQYEFYPTGFQQDQLSAGLNLRQWFNDTVALGATYVKEQRGGQDYELKGVDLTLQKGPQTWVKVEHARSQSQQAPVFLSRDGGLSFAPLNSSTQAALEGKASSIEARLNTQEQGWTERPVQVAGWVRDVDAGFSASHATASDKALREAGGEVTAQVSDNVQLLVSHKKVETGEGLVTGDNELQRTRAGVQVRATDRLRVDAEVQRVTQERKTATGREDSEAGLVGTRLNYTVNDKLDVYAGAQASFSEKNYDSNNAVSVGARYEFAKGSSAQVDLTGGDRGSAVSVTGEYQRTDNHTIYSSYTYAPRSSAPTSTEDLIAARSFSKQTGWTLGQRLQLNSKWRLNHEMQWVLDETQRGLVHTAGLDFAPAPGWSTGLSVQKGRLDQLWVDGSSQGGGRTDRLALSLYGAFSDAQLSWRSKLEHREDRIRSEVASTPQSLQQQWVTTNSMTYKLNEDWRALGKFNYSITDSRSTSGGDVVDARLSDTSLGLAWRPTTGGTHLLMKLQHLYDVAPLGQLGDASRQKDQRSLVASVEGSYSVGTQVELGAKLALRQTQMRLQRGNGSWVKNDARYAAGQVRWKFDRWDDAAKKYELWSRWSVLAEYRVLDTQLDGRKSGYLVSLDKDMNENMRFGVGYNFTDFSTDLTDLSYTHKGWFMNLLLRY